MCDAWTRKIRCSMAKLACRVGWQPARKNVKGRREETHLVTRTSYRPGRENIQHLQSSQDGPRLERPTCNQPQSAASQQTH